jgi:alpha-L-fucosidase 2
VAEQMRNIRQTIFRSPIGEIEREQPISPEVSCTARLNLYADIKEISTPAGAYGGPRSIILIRLVLKTILGSYAGAGYLISTLNSTGKMTNYARWLDLDDAITHTIWSQSGVTFTRFLSWLPRSSPVPC